MYLVRTNVIVALGKLAEFEAWITQYSEVVKAQPGFQLLVHANSLGTPAKHTAMVRWESREAAVAWWRNPALQAFVQAHPFEGLSTMSHAAEAYEFVLGVGEPTAQARYGVLVDWHIDVLRPGTVTAFHRSRQQLFALRQQHGKGFVLNRLWRSLGNPAKYLVVQGYTSSEEAQVVQEIPALQEIGRAYRWSDYASAPPAIEAFEVVHAVL